MNTYQIAAVEAWKRMVAAHLVEDTPSVEADCNLIIKSAIEKAHEDGYIQGARAGVLNEREHRAHASEQDLIGGKSAPEPTGSGNAASSAICSHCGGIPPVTCSETSEYEKGYANGWEACDNEAKISSEHDTKRLDYIMRHPLDSHRLMSRAAIDAAMRKETQ